MVDGIRPPGVERWFEENVPLAKPPFEYQMIAGGRSNLTYKLTDVAGAAFVLRRPPLGQVLESAHDMGREHRIVSALGPTDVPVPPVFGLCGDASVNDAPFYVMGFVEGRVLHDRLLAEKSPAEERASIGIDAIDVLARLHALDPDAVGLGTLGRKEAYVARQLRRWSKQWAQSQTREIPELEAGQRLLEERIPEQVGASIVHGDYRLGNHLVHHGRIAAVLDWELCTLGDPLADLGYLLNNWASPDEIPAGAPNNHPTAAGGFAPREQLLERYADATARDLSAISYYRAFSHYRGAAIAEGVYSRFRSGAYGDQQVDLEVLAGSAPQAARMALELLETPKS